MNNKGTPIIGKSLKFRVILVRALQSNRNQQDVCVSVSLSSSLNFKYIYSFKTYHIQNTYILSYIKIVIYIIIYKINHFKTIYKLVKPKNKTYTF